jgi:16S rRNA (adenine1518-N6/adenine1519-N6)-dimethyltransferase
MKSARLGQHFLTNPRALQRIVQAAPPPPMKVLEIGAGDGRLTRELLNAGYDVVSYELDERLYSQTGRTLGHVENLTLCLGDGFMDRQGYDAVVSSLPYYASRRFIEWFSGSTTPLGIVVLQKDFVDKITSPPGARKYGAYSVLTSHCFLVDSLFVIPPDDFEPRPKVFSSVIRLRRTRSVENGKLAAARLKAVFSYRGRMVASLVRDFKKKGAWNEGIHFNERILRVRVEDLTPSEAMLIAEGLRPG